MFLAHAPSSVRNVGDGQRAKKSRDTSVGIEEPEQAVFDRLATDGLPVTGELDALGCRCSVIPGEPDCADRLLLGSAGRAGDAADRQCDVDPGPFAQTARHGRDHGLADGAMGLDQRLRHAQQLLFGAVGVGDQAALEPSAAAGDVGQHLGDPATGT